MKIDQIAFYAKDDDEASRLKKLLGLENAEWIEDVVTANSSVWGSRYEKNQAILMFNYDLGIELEILRYVAGPSWHDTYENLHHNKGLSFISHVGIHLEDGEEFPEMPLCKLAQETWTINHTSPYLVQNGRTYHYRIYEVSPDTYIKYIKRIHKENV